MQRQLRHVGAVGAAYAAAVAVTLWGRPVVQRVHDLYPAALPPQPYFVPEHAVLLYAALPAVVLAAILVLLAPGVLLLLGSGRPRRAAELITHGFVVALVVQVAAGSIVRLLGATDAAAFRAALVGSGALALGVAALRARAGRAALLPVRPEDGRLAAVAALLAVLLVIALVPVLFWMDINPDGLEAFTSARSLDSHLLPRLPTGRLAGIGLGMTTMAYPAHWFMSLFGPIEAAARLPLVLYVPVLFAGLAGLAQVRAPRELVTAELATVALAICAFTVTLVYNDTYHPYSADPASPANIDVLAAVLMVAAIHALVSGRRAWLIGIAVMWDLTRPTAVMILALLAVASLLLAPREERRAWLLSLAAAVGACVATGALFEGVVAPLVQSGTVQGAGALLARIRYLRFDDVHRIWFVLLPAGILPPLLLVRTWKSDAVAGVLALVSVAYFLFFYSMAFTALHHFAPAMLLPVVAYWRAVARHPASGRVVGVTAAAAMAGLVLSLPGSFEIDRSMRELGSRTLYAVGEYDGTYDARRLAFEHKGLLDSLFTPWDEVADPSAVRVGAPWSQVHYAFRAARAAEGSTYVVLPLDRPAPQGARRIAADDEAALYVTDMERWQRDRSSPPRTDFRSDFHAIPLTTLLQAHGLVEKSYSVDVKAVLTQGRLK